MPEENRSTTPRKLKAADRRILADLSAHGDVTYRHLSIQWPRRGVPQDGHVSVSCLSMGDTVICGIARCSPRDHWNRMEGRVRSMTRVAARLLFLHDKSEENDKKELRATVIISTESMSSPAWLNVVLDTVFRRWNAAEEEKTRNHRKDDER